MYATWWKFDIRSIGEKLTVCDGVRHVVVDRIEAVRAEEQHVPAIGQLRDAGSLNERTIVVVAVKDLVRAADLVDTVAGDLLLHDGRRVNGRVSVATNTTIAKSVALLHK